MDSLSRAYYEVVFERNYLKYKGNQFQDFFSELMEKSHPADFQRVRPWGATGDRKNDGYIRSERTLFQVYAPNELTARAATAKIEEDFLEALPYWGSHFERWIFVHNSRDGLGPDVLNKLLELDGAYPQVTIMHWGYEELRQKVFDLSHADLTSLLGVHAPTRADMSSLGFAELKPLLTRIGDLPEVPEFDLRPVPQDKLIRNSLSPSVQSLIKAGMQRAKLVEDFFASWFRDPQLGDRIAAAFHNEYERLKIIHFDPDDIFYELQVFAGGAEIGTPKRQAAVLAVLAYLFERCDIFERISQEVEA